MPYIIIIILNDLIKKIAVIVTTMYHTSSTFCEPVIVTGGWTGHIHTLQPTLAYLENIDECAKLYSTCTFSDIVERIIMPYAMIEGSDILILHENILS